MSSPSLLLGVNFCTYFALFVIQSVGVDVRVPNIPPVFEIKREWIIPENENPGSRIATIRTKDEDKDEIVYGIEPAPLLDGSNYFSINPKSGDVFLKSSLKGQAGKDYYLLITANDGHHTSKIEVYARVVDRIRSNLDSDMIPNFDSAIRHYPGSSSGSLHPYQSHIFTLNVPSQSMFIPTKRPVFNFKPSATSDTLTSNSTPSYDSIETSTDQTEGVETLESILSKTENSLNKVRYNRKVQMINSFIPLLAVFIFAPVAGLVFYLMYRRSYQTSRRVQNWSKKIKAGKKSENFQVSVNSFSFCSDFRQNFFPPKFDPECTLMKDIDKWEFPRHHLRILGLLGEGCFGRVWKCEAYNIGTSEGVSIVAVKTVKETASEKEKRDLNSELEILKSLDPHPNVVTLLGCCSDEPQFLILEYVPFGTLQSYLRESRNDQFYGNILGTLTARDLTSFVYQIAKGMEYISSKEIIHRDLAARNILIGNNKTCKITDFGFSRNLNTTQVYERKSEGRLPIRWMPPEALYDNIFTIKGDVWSFGILIWEIVTLGSTPYPGLTTKEVMRRVKDGYRLEKPEHCKREMYNIMYYCWDSEPNERPSFVELVKMLDNLIISENDYIELDRFPDHSYYNVVTYLSGEKL